MRSQASADEPAWATKRAVSLSEREAVDIVEVKRVEGGCGIGGAEHFAQHFLALASHVFVQQMRAHELLPSKQVQLHCAAASQLVQPRAKRNGALLLRVHVIERSDLCWEARMHGHCGQDTEGELVSNQFIYKNSTFVPLTHLRSSRCENCQGAALSLVEAQQAECPAG